MLKTFSSKISFSIVIIESLVTLNLELKNMLDFMNVCELHFIYLNTKLFIFVVDLNVLKPSNLREAHQYFHTQNAVLQR